MKQAQLAMIWQMFKICALALDVQIVYVFARCLTRLHDLQMVSCCVD